MPARNGGFAGTDAADNSDPLAGGDLERDLAEGILVRIGIAERDVLEGNAAVFDAARNIGSFRGPLALQIHDPIDGLERDEGLRRTRDDGCNAGDRRKDAA